MLINKSMLLLFVCSVFTLLSIFVPLEIFGDSCGSSFTATDSPQNMTTPLYPNNFVGDQQSPCMFTFTAGSPDKLVVLKFFDFDFADTNTYIIILKEGGDQYYSFEKSIPLITNTKYVLPEKGIFDLVFIGSQTGMKFFLTYYQTALADVSDKYVATDTWASFSTPNYPNDYPVNIVKLYRIVTSNSFGILMFKIQTCNVDRSDFVIIYKGSVVASENRVLFMSCSKISSSLPYSFNITNNESLVLFVSNQENVLTGFNIAYAMFLDPIFVTTTIATTTTTTTTTPTSTKLKMTTRPVMTSSAGGAIGNVVVIDKISSSLFFILDIILVLIEICCFPVSFA